MKKPEKKEKPTPKRCVCGREAIFVKTRMGKMYTCPNPCKCQGNLRTPHLKDQDQAIAEWNNQVYSFYAKEGKGKKVKV